MSVEAASRLLGQHDDRPGRDRRRHLLRLAVEGLPGLAGGAVDRAPARLRERLRARVRERLVRDAGRAAAARATSCSPSPTSATCCSWPRAASRTSSTTANERSRFMFNFGDGAVAGLLTRDGGARAARLPCAHGRLVLAPGEGAGRRLGRARLGRERRRPAALPRRRRPGADEGRASTRSACRTSSPPRVARSSAQVRQLEDVLVSLRDPHEALDARGDRRRARRPARRLSRRHRPHERRRLAARARPRRRAPASSRRAISSCCSRRARATRGRRR